MSRAQHPTPGRPLLLLLVVTLFGLTLAAGSTPVGAQVDDCDEPNDTADLSCDLTPGTSVSGYIEAADDVDRFRFDIQPNQTIRATLTGLPGDYGLRLEEASGAPVIEAGGSGAADRSLEARLMPPGTYLVVVYSRSGDASPDQPYTLTVNLADATSAPRTGGNQSSGPQGQPKPQDPQPSAGGSTAKDPAEISLGNADVGKEITQAYLNRNSDGRSNWSEIRWVRSSGAIGLGLGPLKIVNKVWVARDVAAAQAIFKEEVANQGKFPEAEDHVGTIYLNDGKTPKNTVKKVGDEMDSRAACNDNCGTARFDRLHQRTVMRYQNFVTVIYFWGTDTSATTKQMDEWLAKVRERMNDRPAGSGSEQPGPPANPDESDEDQ